jgi:hypothetical protein
MSTSFKFTYPALGNAESATGTKAVGKISGLVTL